MESFVFLRDCQWFCAFGLRCLRRKLPMVGILLQAGVRQQQYKPEKDPYDYLSF